jgi:hypothetical protein
VTLPPQTRAIMETVAKSWQQNLLQNPMSVSLSRSRVEMLIKGNQSGDVVVHFLSFSCKTRIIKVWSSCLRQDRLGETNEECE